MFLTSTKNSPGSVCNLSTAKKCKTIGYSSRLTTNRCHEWIYPSARFTWVCWSITTTLQRMVGLPYSAQQTAIKHRCSFRGKGGWKKKSINKFHFPPKLDIHSYFHTICALLAKFGILDNFDHILPHFSTAKSWSRWAKILIVNTSIWSNQQS